MIRAFEFADLEDLNAWSLARGGGTIAASRLPGSGYIAPGIAAAFMYRTDSDVAILDTLISNPAAGKHETGLAIIGILQAILDEVKADAKIRRLVACTAIDSVKRLLVGYGMSDYGGSYSFFAKET